MVSRWQRRVVVKLLSPRMGAGPSSFSSDEAIETSVGVAPTLDAILLSPPTSWRSANLTHLSGGTGLGARAGSGRRAFDIGSAPDGCLDAG